jgi:hypothetical protein
MATCRKKLYMVYCCDMLTIELIHESIVLLWWRFQASAEAAAEHITANLPNIFEQNITKGK